MWKCTICLREFKAENQDHYCSDPPKNIDQYISAQPENIRAILYEVRETMRSALPKAQERISWRMPTFWDKHNIIHFAAFKKHLGIFPGSEAIEHFAEKLKEYKTSKGTIQFQYSQPIPFSLISEIAKWCDENSA